MKGKKVNKATVTISSVLFPERAIYSVIYPKNSWNENTISSVIVYIWFLFLTASVKLSQNLDIGSVKFTSCSVTKNVHLFSPCIMCVQYIGGCSVHRGIP